MFFWIKEHVLGCKKGQKKQRKAKKKAKGQSGGQKSLYFCLYLSGSGADDRLCLLSADREPNTDGNDRTEPSGAERSRTISSRAESNIRLKTDEQGSDIQIFERVNYYKTNFKTHSRDVGAQQLGVVRQVRPLYL